MTIYNENFKRLLNNLCKQMVTGTTLSEDAKIHLDIILKKLLSYILKTSDNIKSVQSSIKKILSSKLYNNAMDNCKVFSNLNLTRSLERIIKKYSINKDCDVVRFISCVSYYIMYEIIETVSDKTRDNGKTRITSEYINSAIHADFEIKRLISKINNKSMNKSSRRTSKRRSRKN